MKKKECFICGTIVIMNFLIIENLPILCDRCNEVKMQHILEHDYVQYNNDTMATYYISGVTSSTYSIIRDLKK